MLGNILNRSITYSPRFLFEHINRTFCPRKRTENDTVHESESQRKSETGDQKLLWKLTQPCTFDGVLIFSKRLSYTPNWFTFQSMHLPHTKAPEARTFSAVYSCPCSGEEDSCFLQRGVFSRSIMRRYAFSSFFIFPSVIRCAEICDVVVYLSVFRPLISRWLGNVRLMRD